MNNDKPKESLLGDQIANLVEDQVLKRLRRFIEISSEPCNSCTKRKLKLNQYHARWKAITGRDFDPERD